MKIKDFTTGVQHIGIPTNDINKTIEFYHALGFETALRTVNGTEEVTAHPINQEENSLILYKICTFAP